MGGFDTLHDALRFALVSALGQLPAHGARVKSGKLHLLAALRPVLPVVPGFLKIRVLRPLADTFRVSRGLIFCDSPVAGHFLRDFIAGL